MATKVAKKVAKKKKTKKKTSDSRMQKIKRRIDLLARERPSHKEILKFFKQVLVEQSKVKSKIKLDSIKMDKELVKVKIEEGFPLVERKDLKLDITSATILFKRLCDVLGRNKRVSEDAECIAEAVRDGEIELEELFKKAVVEDWEYIATLSEKLKLKRELIEFLVKNSLTPIFEVYAHKLRGYIDRYEDDQVRWWRNYCPICGSKPLMSEFKEDGKRFLLCSYCGHEWRFIRLKCPFCENNDRKTLRYFHTKKEGTKKEGRAYRVEVCDKCKKYIKTVDTRRLGEHIIPAVEDIGTLHLDILAQKEGYTRDTHQLGFSLGDV